MPENKVLGIEIEKFAKICYILVLTASVFGVLSNLLGLIGVALFGATLSMVIGLVGIAGIAMAATGWAGFREKFTDLDVSHLKYIVVLFVIFFVSGMILGMTLIDMGFVGRVLLTCFAALQLALLFTGYSLLKAGTLATKDNIINGVKNLPALLKK